MTEDELREFWEDKFDGVGRGKAISLNDWIDMLGDAAPEISDEHKRQILREIAARHGVTAG